ncbi:hypothetical protein BU23DRAFT_549316 [Bimuria novae-zelandiae CBS 107.79]|uniref:Uncharacterized protein n=1 Tax=Bimuria novae-zelandiae CBS 107.79 TaxID=1447943 RepID=A0A6A5VUB4_9PLEO|nr:hypothetical protein BU23DRAFT_549316 [Bimuria novae-zelandiae CBS 107.79]
MNNNVNLLDTDHGRRDERAAVERAAPSAASPPRPRNKSPDTLQNGANSDDDALNESEAETVVLDHKTDRAEGEVIKTERSDDDDAARLRSVKEAVIGRSASHGRSNGIKHGSDVDVKSPVPTSPSSRTTSRHTKETSPTDSARSPVHSAASPPQPTGRGRSASTVESRKRKMRDESHPKALEPPRQKAKIDGTREMRQPTSPATPGLGRPHKRSQSTQSFVTGAPGRKRKDTNSLAVSTERKNWSDDSSENSSSSRPTQTPNLPTQSRPRGRPGRATTSPGRTMAPRRVDRFGSTRLARESEKGNLDAVQKAYEAAPEEIDVPDFAGITPLQKASLHGWDEVVSFLISKGCRTDCESNDRDTPLIDAVENGHLDVVKILLHEGHVNPHHQNKKGQRAIDVLPSKNDVDHPPDVDEIEKELKTAMRREVDTAATNDEDSSAGVTQTKSTSRLLYNEYNTETMIEKAADGDIVSVGELINSNVKINIACGNAASRGGHYDILSILLASGLKPDPDPSKHNETPMLVAIGRGHLKIVSLLLEQDNFNPTRRNREGKTYWEISEERRGPKWEQERDMLKQAFDAYATTRRSPKRVKKEPPNPAARLKRKSSPSIRRDRSASPRPDRKPASLTKTTSGPHAPQKSRRLLSGKEMAASREGKRQRRIVDEETSDDDSDEEVRAPVKKSSKPRSYSDGEEHKSIKRVKNGKSRDAAKGIPRAASHDHSDQDRSKSKIRTKTEHGHVKNRMDTDSADERKLKSKIKPRPMEKDVHNIKKRQASNDSVDDVKVKRTPTVSAKSTPAPPEKASTPEVVRERRLEEQRQMEKQAEAKKKAAEEETRKREEEATRKREEEAARKSKEEEDIRKAAEEEAQRREEAEAEARRVAEEAEAARKLEEEEAQQRAAEEAKRQEELVARQRRVERLPRALRRACELGNNRPLHFSGEELGISAVYLPLFYATSADLQIEATDKVYIPSFQAVGILGLPELDIAHLSAPYSSWQRIPFTANHRDLLLRQYDVARLAQDFRFPMEGAPDFDYSRIQERIKEARQQFLEMEGLYWVEAEAVEKEAEKVETLQPLLDEIKDGHRRRRIHLAEAQTEAVPEKKHKPRKSFMDMVLAQNGVNGVALKVNGEG